MRSPRYYPGDKEDGHKTRVKERPSGTMARVRRFFKISLGGNQLKGTNQSTVSRRNSHSSQQVILKLKQEAVDVIGRPIEDLMVEKNKLDAFGIPTFLHNLCCHIINCGVDYDALLSDDWCPKHARNVIFDGEENPGSPIGITEEMFVATSLLRLFLSELPHPLLQREVILTLMDLCKDNLNSEFDNEIGDLVASQIKCVLIEKLPDHSFRLMEYLSAFLHQLDMSKSDLCRVSPADLCRVLGGAIAKSSCHDVPNEYSSCRVVQLIFFNYETIFTDESHGGDCNSYPSDSTSETPVDLYSEDKNPYRSPDEDSSTTSNSSEEFCLPVVSPLKDFGRPVTSCEPRSTKFDDPEGQSKLPYAHTSTVTPDPSAPAGSSVRKRSVTTQPAILTKKSSNRHHFASEVSRNFSKFAESLLTSNRFLKHCDFRSKSSRRYSKSWRSSREVSETEKAHAKPSYKKETFRSITDLLSSPGDTSRDEGVRYSSFEYKEWSSQLSGDSSGLSEDADSTSESEAARDADRSDIEGAATVQAVCPHEERRSSERFCPGFGSYKEKKSKNRRKVKRKHSKSSMQTKAQPPLEVESEEGDGGVKEDFTETPNVDQLVKPFTDLLVSSEPATTTRDPIGAWGSKMSHIDDSHRTVPIYSRDEEEDHFGDSGDSSSKRSSMDRSHRRSPGQQMTKSLTKNINSLKKKIKRYEENFEASFGYKPSHSDKMKNSDIRPLVAEINKLRKEFKKAKEEIADKIMPRSFNFEECLPGSSTLPPDMVHTLRQMENMLSDKRKEANRPVNIGDMTMTEVLEEKTELQRTLLFYEHKHGRPSTKEDRNLARPLYDRYREIKRTIVRATSRTKENMVELAPILENEAMDFTLASPQHRGSLQGDVDVREQEALLECAAINPDPHPGVVPCKPDSPRPSVNLEDLHALPTVELKNRKRLAKDEKKILRTTLKDFEEKFERDNGRKVQKEDRGPMEENYREYKHAKAKVKLLDALLAKHEHQI